MNKLIIRSILAVLAIVPVLLLLFRDRLPFGSSNSSFAAGSGKEITKVDLSAQGKRLTLEKKGENWYINDGQEARKSGILFLLRILKEITIKSPVSASLFRSEITDKGIEPVKVRVYENRRLIRDFLVYKTGSNIYGNMMKIREGSKPFIVFVPGFDGDIGSAFITNELFWKPYTVFNLLPSEIKTVVFENVADTSSSFKIDINDRRFTLSASGKPLAGWDSALVARYLSYFARIPFEKWDLDMSSGEKMQIGSKQPMYRISVTASDGKITELTLWQREKEENGHTVIDTDRLLGRTPGSSEFFIMRYFDIDPLLKRRTYFFPE